MRESLSGVDVPRPSRVCYHRACLSGWYKLFGSNDVAMYSFVGALAVIALGLFTTPGWKMLGGGTKLKQ